MQAEHELDAQAEDHMLRALGTLPKPTLDAERRAQIQAAMRHALCERSRPGLAARWLAVSESSVEPALLALCACLVLVRLAVLLARSLGT